MSTALVLDNGLFPEVARRLAQEGYDVRYHSVWGNAFPTSRELIIGTGIEGVKRVDEPLKSMLWEPPDLVVVPDLYLNDYEAAARAMEIPTMGAGEGNRLETDRWLLKEYLESEGCDVIKSVEIIGVEPAYAYLQEHPDTYIKVSVFRGDMETHQARDWLTEYHDFRKQVGEAGRKMRFVVEDPIPDALEIGVDGWWYRGELLEPFLVGAEIKDAGYIGYVCDSVRQLPDEAQKILKAMGKYFAKTDYASFFSNEMRVLKSGQTFMTDATCRVPSPPGGVMMRACRNFGEVVKGLAYRKPIAPDFGDVEYASEIVLKSDWLQEHYLEVDFPKKLRDDYGFHLYCVIDGKTWILPHDSKMVEFGSALGLGSLEASVTMAQQRADEVKAYQLDYGRDALDKAQEAMADAAKLGYAL